MSSTRVRMGQLSLQFSDRNKHKEADVITLFEHANKRDYWWVTGTEATGKRRGTNDNPAQFYLRKYAREYGWYFFINQENDSWIVIKKSKVDFLSNPKGSFYRRVIPKSSDHGHRGVLTRTFVNNCIGKVTVGSAHYLTRGNPYAIDPARRERVAGNRKLAARIGRRLRHMSRGKRLSFLGADTNIAGKPGIDQDLIPDMITCWEELGRWPGTGYGNIDIISRHRSDKRVKLVNARTYNDKQLFLHTDHFLVEAEYEIRNL